MAQPLVVEKKIIELNQPLAWVNKIKNINKHEFGAVGKIINDGGDRDMFFAKFDLDSLVFSKSYNSDISFEARDFEIMEDSSFIIVGNNSLLKINNKGDSLWFKQFEETNNNSIIYSIVKTDDGNYIACGYWREYYPPLIYNSVWLIKFNEQGEVIWDKKYHKESNYESDYGVIVEYTKDNNLIISGTIGGSIFILKTDSVGNEIFYKLYNNYGLLQGLVKSRYITEGLDDSYYLTGSIPIWNHAEDILLIKTNYMGDTLFVKNYNGNPIDWDPNTSSGNEYGVCIKVLDSNSILLGGNGTQRFTNQQLKIILRLDSLGSISWKHVIESENYSRLFSIEISNENKLLYLGVDDALPNKIFIIKTSYDITDIPKEQSIPLQYFLSQNYPNPFNPVTKIQYSLQKSSYVTIKVYDILGNEITTLVDDVKQAGNYNIEFIGNNLSSGIYYYRMQSRNFSETKKFILLQ